MPLLNNQTNDLNELFEELQSVKIPLESSQKEVVEDLIRKGREILISIEPALIMGDDKHLYNKTNSALSALVVAKKEFESSLNDSEEGPPQDGIVDGQPVYLIDENGVVSIETGAVRDQGPAGDSKVDGEIVRLINEDGVVSFEKVPVEKSVAPPDVQNLTEIDDGVGSFEEVQVEQRVAPPDVQNLTQIDDGFVFVSFSPEVEKDDENRSSAAAAELTENAGGWWSKLRSLRSSGAPAVTSTKADEASGPSRRPNV